MQRTSTRALGRPIVLVFVLPVVVLAMTEVASALTYMLNSGAGRSLSDSDQAAYWFGYSFVISLWAGLNARNQVLSRARLLAMYGFDYRSEREEWMRANQLGGKPRTRKRIAAFWPESILGQVAVVSILVGLALVLVGQVRQNYYERRFDRLVAGFDLPPTDSSETPVSAPGSIVVEGFGELPEELALVANQIVAPSKIQSVAKRDLFAVLSQKGGSIAETDPEVLKLVLEGNAFSLSLLLEIGGDGQLLTDQPMQALGSYQSGRNLVSVFEVLACFVAYDVLSGEGRRAGKALGVMLRLADYLIADAHSYLVGFGYEGLMRSGHALRWVLEKGRVSGAELRDLDEQLATLTTYFRVGGQVREILRGVRVTAKMPSPAFGNPRDPDWARRIGRYKLRKAWGTIDRDWVAVLQMVKIFLPAIDALDSDDPATYRALYPMFEQRCQLMADESGPQALGYYLRRMIDDRVHRKSQIRLMRTAIAIERYRQRIGMLPLTLDLLVDEAVPDRLIDPYSAELFEYERVDHGYTLQTAPRWRTSDVVEWRQVVSAE